MRTAKVIAVDKRRGVFAVDLANGKAAVFYQHFGPNVEVGDLLSGSVEGKGSRTLGHPNGTCRVLGDTGLISIEEAIYAVNGKQDLLLSMKLAANAQSFCEKLEIKGSNRNSV